MPSRREYTEAERISRGLDKWRDDPEMLIADLIMRIRILEKAMKQSEPYAVARGAL